MLQCSRTHGGCTLVPERVHSAQKKYIFHTMSSRQNAAMQQILQHALPGHASMEIQEQGTELEGNTEQCTAHITTDNMKEHLNRTACGFFNSNCSTPAGSSSVPHDPIMSGFLLACLLMKHQGKHFPARRMQEAGSGTARRLPLEDSLLSRKEESSSALCMSASPGIYWGITCTASED